MADSLSPDDVLDPSASWKTMVRRGMAKHCPRCGGGHLYRGWFRMKDRCPTCGFRFEREPVFFVPAAFINLSLTEGLLYLLMIGLIAVLSQNADAGLALPISVGAVLAIACPIVFYPFSRTIWSAIDLSMTPLELEEIIAARDFLAVAEVLEDLDLDLDLGASEVEEFESGHEVDGKG